MKLKIWLGRIIPLVIIALGEIVLYCNLFKWLTTSFVFIEIVLHILSILIVLNIVRTSRHLSSDLMWIILIMLFPVFGTFVYVLMLLSLLFGKTFRNIIKEQKKASSYYIQDESIIDEIRNDNPDYVSQLAFLHKEGFPFYRNTDFEYYAPCENGFNVMLEELKKAEKYIFMEYFIVEEGFMFNSILSILEEKVKQGVEVCFMYDDVGCISKVKKDYYLELRDKGIQACKFNPFKPVISVMHNNRDHRKITVIDGVKGFVSGANLADEYINETHPYGLWYDNAVFLEGKCIDSLVLMFIRMYNPNSVKKLNAKDYLVEHKKFNTKGFVAPYCDGPCPIYNDYIGQNVYLNLINQAKKYLYITTPYLIVDYEFIEAIINAKKRGVDVILITPNIPDKKIINIMTKSNYGKLIENGVKIYEYKDGFIHSKMIVCDDELASIGTINLDYRSFVHHFECGVWMYNCKDILQMKKTFLAIIKDNSVKITNNNSKLKFYQKLIRNILRLLAPLM